jgi:hypothetical protein
MPNAGKPWRAALGWLLAVGCQAVTGCGQVESSDGSNGGRRDAGLQDATTPFEDASQSQPESGLSDAGSKCVGPGATFCSTGWQGELDYAGGDTIHVRACLDGACSSFSASSTRNLAKKGLLAGYYCWEESEEVARNEDGGTAVVEQDWCGVISVQRDGRPDLEVSVARLAGSARMRFELSTFGPPSPELRQPGDVLSLRITGESGEALVDIETAVRYLVYTKELVPPGEVVTVDHPGEPIEMCRWAEIDLHGVQIDHEESCTPGIPNEMLCTRWDDGTLCVAL